MKIQFFDDSVESFIYSLESSVVAKTLRTIDLLEKFGNRLGMPHSKKVALRLFELRVHGTHRVRIFYSFHDNGVVLLYGFIKKSPKIPRKELAVAKQRMRILGII